jgi:hypothetical protein
MAIAPNLWALCRVGAVISSGSAGFIGREAALLQWIMATYSPKISPELMELLSSIR